MNDSNTKLAASDMHKSFSSVKVLNGISIEANDHDVIALLGASGLVPKGEVEAAKSIGMSPARAMFRIIFPSALRRALPAYSNEVIFVLHGSVVASTITIIDILGAGQLLNNRYYVAFKGFIGAAVLYMLLVYIITRGFHFWEQRWLKHLKPREQHENAN